MATRSFSGSNGGVVNGPTAFSQSTPTSNFTTTTGNAANVTPLVQALGLTSDESAALIARFSADASPPRQMFVKSRSATVNGLANIVAEDVMGSICAAGVVGGVVREGMRIEFTATSFGTFPNGSMRVFTSDGTAAPVERFRVAHSGAIQMGGTNTVISSERHHTLRSYTTGTLPAATTAAQMIYVSDATGSGLAVSNGSSWSTIGKQAEAVTPLTVNTGGSVGDVLGAQSTLVSLTDNSGGTAGSTVNAIADANTRGAIASIIAKLTQVQQQCNAMKNSITSLGTKDNQILTALKNAGLMAP